MVSTTDEFRTFEEMMNRMFEEFWGKTCKEALAFQ